MATKQAEKPTVDFLRWPRDNMSKNKEWLKGRSKILTGYCTNYPEGGVNAHEGTRPKNWKGKPLPTCPMYETCPCSCHERTDQMFEITGLERKNMNNPDYVPEKHASPYVDVAENPLDNGAVTSEDVVVTPNVQQDGVAPPAPRPGPPVAHPALAQRRTETGRAARGGLEAQVWDAHRNGPLLAEATPKQIADWIASKYTIPTPSSGAINAVWDRWEKLGFCTQAKKPNRFTGFTKTGTWDELSHLKASAKGAKRRGENEAKRSFRRP